MSKEMVVIRGGGDLGSGVAVRLLRAGFPIVILESERPVAVRRSVAFAEAVYEGVMQVEEVVAERIHSPQEAGEVLRRGRVAVLVDPRAEMLNHLSPRAVVDAIMAKRNLGMRIDLAPLTIGLGPGFKAEQDVHAVVETNRGPHLGRVIWKGTAEPNTGEPGVVGGQSAQRVLRAPASGRLTALREIGDVVQTKDVLATVDGAPVRAPFRSLVRGLARDGLEVERGMKVGDVDPRLDPLLCTLVSDKALAVAGGVLEAVLSSLKHA